MSKTKPFIHLFKTPRCNYLYDANRNMLLEVEEDTYRVLKEVEEGSKDIDEASKEHASIRKLKEQGLVMESAIEEMIHPHTDCVQYYLDTKLGSLCLQVTQQCNLRCSYCTYSGNYENRTHSPKRMSFEIAKKSIDFILKHSIDEDILVIGFYGGEPLLEFDLIKKIVEYSLQAGDGKNVRFNLTTNGTLITEEIVEYFQKHRVRMVISLDGPQKIHDMNRNFANGKCGSYETVMGKLDMIKNKFPDYFEYISFSIVLDSSREFGCINEFFTDYEDFKNMRSPSFITGFINEVYTDDVNVVGEEFLWQWRYEHFKRHLERLGKLKKERVSKLVASSLLKTKQVIDILQSPSEPIKRCSHGGPCIPGMSKVFVDVEGYFHPCEKVSETSEVMKIGHIDKGFFMDKVRDMLNVCKITEDHCKNCWAVKFCFLCAVYADGQTCLSAEKKLSMCDLSKEMAERRILEYCMLKELGYDLDREDIVL